MKHSFKERFAYWFDSRMSKGTADLIRLLAVVSVLAVALVAVLLVAFGYSEAKYGSDVFWDSFATIINAWMPYYSDGDGSIGYLVIMAVAAITGLLITSVLIGIFTTAIEEYIEGLKDSKSTVLEKDHIVLLSDYTLEDEDADIQSIFRIMHFRDIRTRLGLKFNITAEMCKKANLNLIREDEHMDYVASSNMSSLLLAQLSENYELTGVFTEILDNDGNELRLKKAGNFGLEGTYTTLQLRNLALSNNAVLLGYMRGENFESFFNPDLNEEITLSPEDSLIVLAED